MNPQPNFDPVARPYRWLEYLTFGRALERRRFYFLPRLPSRRRALALGDGDGRFLVRLLLQNSSLHADAVDTSIAMLQLLQHRCAKAADRLQTHHADALDFTPPPNCDLVITHFFLDCLSQPELNALIAHITPTLAPGALWLISDFRITAGPMHLPARLLVRALYLAFRIFTGLRTTHLPDHETPLRSAGLTRTTHQEFLGGLLFTELWQKTAAPPTMEPRT